MTERQKRFVLEYVLDQNGAAAATRAGFSEKSAKVTASRLLTKDNVRSAVRAQQAAVAAENRVSRDLVVGQLLEGIALARRNNDARSMISAWRTIARMCGYV